MFSILEHVCTAIVAVEICAIVWFCLNLLGDERYDPQDWHLTPVYPPEERRKSHC